jgi:hypothetical protein
MAEKLRNTRVLGLVTSSLILIAFIYILSTEPFPHNKLTHIAMIPTSQSDNLGKYMGQFMWNFRGLDLLMQSILLFSTAICCLALFRREGE